ncbi:MAG: hypothetical protein ACRC2H_01050 [Silanimonas sp.]
MTLQSAFDELLARHNGDVLPLTVHVLRNPTRIALLCADGNRREYRVTDAGATAMAAPIEQPLSQPAADHAAEPAALDGSPPPTQRVVAVGFQDAMFYGRPAGEA